MNAALTILPSTHPAPAQTARQRQVPSQASFSRSRSLTHHLNIDPSGRIISSAPRTKKLYPKIGRVLNSFTQIKPNTKPKIFLVDVAKPGNSLYGESKPIAVDILDEIASKHDFQTKSLQLKSSKSAQEQLMTELKPGDIVALTCTSPGNATALEIAQLIKNTHADQVLVIKGGIHEKMAAPRERFNPDYPIDISFMGEAEHSFPPFLKLLASIKRDRLEPKQIVTELEKFSDISFFHRSTPAAVINRGKGITGDQMLIPSQPKPEELFSIFRKPKQGSKMHRLMTMRGCPFHCTFCAVNLKSKRASVDYVFEKLEKLIELSYKQNEPITHLFLEDANFLTVSGKGGALDKRVNVGSTGAYFSNEWIAEFSNRMKALNTKLTQEGKEALKFAIQTRSDTIINNPFVEFLAHNEDTVRDLKQAGLTAIYIGVDNNKGFNEQGKQIDPEDHLSAVKFLRDEGIDASCSTILVSGEESATLKTIESLMLLHVPEIFTEYMKVYPDAPDAARVFDANENQLGQGLITDWYTYGRTSQGSASIEDSHCIIVKPHLTMAHKLVRVCDDELKVNSQKAYAAIAQLAEKYGYKSSNNGHYMLAS